MITVWAFITTIRAFLFDALVSSEQEKLFFKAQNHYAIGERMQMITSLYSSTGI